MKSNCLAIGMLVLLMAGVASADSLVVNGTAAMEGSFGMQVSHDNSSQAYVQDNSPNAESIYRASFLFNPNNISPENGNWRQTIFLTLGPNPNPGVGACPSNPSAFLSGMRVFLYMTRGGQDYSVQVWGRGNQCGEASTMRIAIPSNGPSRICTEFETGPTLTGAIRLAAVSGTGACPAGGDPSWREQSMSNNRNQIDLVRLGTPQLNNFGRGENGVMYFDDFQSFRTLAP